MEKLVLKNFRSFSYKEFEFNSNSGGSNNSTTILITGPSGSGKTTIFLAIRFALTGEGKKLVRNTKSSCTVILTMKSGIKIERMKGPGRLLVYHTDGKTYEDKAAQGIIDKHIGDVGYVSQRMYNSFVAQTPSEKLATIEAISAEEFTKIMTNCKSLISKRKELLNSTDAERNALGLFDGDKIKKPDVIIPCTQDDIDQQDKLCIKYCQNRAIKTSLIERRKELEQAIVELEQTPIIANIPDADEINRMIEQKKLYDKYLSLTKELESLNPPSGIDEQALNTLIKETSRMVELESKLTVFQLYVEELNRLDEYRMNNTVLLECPNCKQCLKLVDKKLTICCNVSKTISIEEALKIDEKRAKLAVNVDTYVDMKKEYESLRTRYVDDGNGGKDFSARAELLKLQTILKNDTKYTEIKSAIKSLIASDDVVEPPPYDIDQIISDLKSNQRIISLLEAKRTELANVNKQISKINAENNDFNDNPNDKLKQMYLSYKYEKYRLCKDRIDDCTRRREECVKGIPRAVLLQSVISSAEREAVVELIKLLNIRATIYMDKFFKCSPCVSATLLFEDKLQLDIRIDDFDSDVMSLSGGEYARVVLAYAIAIAEIRESNILMLDEILASLDSETSDRVVEAIEENFAGQIFLIAHQITRGKFSNIIELP